jgi:nucleoside-diphosphate-sugar epimerase
MTYLITGGAGFVGMNLIEQLLGRGEAVVVFGKDPFPLGADQALATLPGTVTLVNGDVRDRAALASVFQDHGIERLFHGAVITAGADREANDPHTILDVNLQGTATVMEVARDYDVKRIVYPSSNSVYGESFYKSEYVEEERTPPIPISLYAITKYAGERMALRLAELWGLDVVCARIGSVFGPWERDTGVRDLLGPHFQLAQMAVRGEEAVLPSTILRRPWVYSRDVASGLVALFDAQNPPHRVYNVALGQEWGERIFDWCRRLEQEFPHFRWRKGGGESDANVRFHEKRPRCPESVERIGRELGWHPQFEPAKAYEDYAAWIRANQTFFLR